MVDGLCVGDAHGCVLTRDGRIACWGDNQFHQVSSEDATQLDAPTWSRELPPATRLRCGPAVTCALSRAGEIECVGFRYHESTRVYRVSGAPANKMKVALPRPARDFSVGANGGCAILDDHRVSCWSEQDPLSPFAVPGVDDAEAFAVASARASRVCLTRTRADPICVRFAGLDPRNPIKGFPLHVTPLPALRGAKELLATGDGTEVICGRGLPAAAGGVTCVNAEGGAVSAPVTATKPTAFVATNGTLTCVREGARVGCAAAGEDASTSLGRAVPGDAAALGISSHHACAIVRGRVSCWGEASRGQLGDGTRYLHGPAAAPGIADATAVVAGHGVACTVRGGDKLTCWGRRSSSLSLDPAGFAGFAGFADVTDVATPSPIGEPAIGRLGQPCGRIGKRESCWDGSRWVDRAQTEGKPDRSFAPAGSALSPDGACAVDRKGRLGCADCPNCEPRRAGVAWQAGPFVEAISLGGAPGEGRIACARRKDGHVACFRMSAEGPKLVPIAEPDLAALADVVKLVAAVDSATPAAAPESATLACALTRAGAVTCWSDGRLAQLGARSSAAPAPVPAPPGARGLSTVKIEGLPPATDIAVGGAFACATTRDRQVYCWGSNRDGGAPNGAPRARAEPVSVRWPPPP